MTYMAVWTGEWQLPPVSCYVQSKGVMRDIVFGILVHPAPVVVTPLRIVVQIAVEIVDSLVDSSAVEQVETAAVGIVAEEEVTD